jgi:hypothetical protein
LRKARARDLIEQAANLEEKLDRSDRVLDALSARNTGLNDRLKQWRSDALVSRAREAALRKCFAYYIGRLGRIGVVETEGEQLMDPMVSLAESMGLLDRRWEGWLDDVEDQEFTAAVVEALPGDGDYRPGSPNRHKWRTPDATQMSERFMVINGARSTSHTGWREQQPRKSNTSHGAKPLEAAQLQQRDQQQRLVANEAEKYTFSLEEDVPRLVCAKQRAEHACMEWEAKWYEGQQRNDELCEQVR